MLSGASVQFPHSNLDMLCTEGERSACVYHLGLLVNCNIRLRFVVAAIVVIVVVVVVVVVVAVVVVVVVVVVAVVVVVVVAVVVVDVVVQERLTYFQPKVLTGF